VHEEMTDELVHFHHEVPALPLEEIASLLEVVLSLFFELLNVQEGSSEIIERNFGDFFDIHYFVHRHPVRCGIFFDIVGIGIVMTRHTL
jgi:hypothetical protein